MDSQFGEMLRDWRGRRRMSQLDLGLAADVSTRHIAFLETGRSRPTRGMVIRLSEALEVPRTARNPLLNAAGFAPAYRARDLNEAEMRHVRMAVDWMLQRHAPYPAMAIDRHWCLVALNAPAGHLLDAIGLGVGDSLLDAFTGSEVVRNAFENWPEVARHMQARLRTESAHLGGDAVLEASATKLAGEIGSHVSDATTLLPPIVPARYRAKGLVLSFFSTLAQFGSAEDMALADLRIELMFPADETTRQALVAMAGQDGSASA